MIKRFVFFFQAEDGIRDRSPSRGLGDVYKRQISPDSFKRYETFARDLGFRHVESGPLVRSSYKAHKHVN